MSRSRYQGYHNPAAFLDIGNKNIHGRAHTPGNWVSTMDMGNVSGAIKLPSCSNLQGQINYNNRQVHDNREVSGICNTQNVCIANQFNGQVHMHNLGYGDNGGQHCNTIAYGNIITVEPCYNGNAYGNAINTSPTENSEGMEISLGHCIGQGGWGCRLTNHIGDSQKDGNKGNLYRGTNNLGHAYEKDQTYNRSNVTNAMTEIHPMGIITATSNSSTQGHTYGGVWYPFKEQRGSRYTDQHPQLTRREPKNLVFQKPSEEALQDQAVQINRTIPKDATDLIKQISDCLDKHGGHAKGQEYPAVKPTGTPITFKNTSRAARKEYDVDGSSYITSRMSLHLHRERGRWQERRKMAKEIIMDILDTVLDIVKDDSPRHWSKDTTRPWRKEVKERLSKTNTIDTPWGRRKGPFEDPMESSLCDPLPKKRGGPTLEISPVKTGKKSVIHGEEVLVATDLFPTRPRKASKGPQSNDKPTIGKGRVIIEIIADTQKDQSWEGIKPTGETLMITEQEQVLAEIDTFRTVQSEPSQGPQSPMVPIVGKGRDRTTTHIESHTDQPCGDLKFDTLCLYVAILQFLEYKTTETYDCSQDTKAKASALRGQTISLIKDKLQLLETGTKSGPKSPLIDFLTELPTRLTQKFVTFDDNAPAGKLDMLALAEIVHHDIKVWFQDSPTTRRPIFFTDTGNPSTIDVSLKDGHYTVLREEELLPSPTWDEAMENTIKQLGWDEDNQTRHLVKGTGNYQNSSSQAGETSTAEMERVLMEIDTFRTAQGPQCATMPIIGRGFVATTTPTDSPGDQPGGDLTLDKLCPSGATHQYMRPAIFKCEIILFSHGIIERIWSFLEGRQLMLVCKTWKTIVGAYEPCRKAISFQSGTSANSLVQLPGKFKNVRKIKKAMIKNCSQQLQYVDLSNTETIGEDVVEDLVRHFTTHCPNLKAIDMSGCTESDIIRAMSLLVLAMFQEREKRMGRSQTLTPLQLFHLLQQEICVCHGIPPEEFHLMEPEARPRLPLEALRQINNSLDGITLNLWCQDTTTLTWHQKFTPGRSAFEKAVTGSPWELVLLLSLEVQGEDFQASDRTINILSERGRSPLLHCAIALGQSSDDAVNILIQAKGDVEQADSDGVSPIVLAASKGSMTVVEALETSGANPFDHRRQDGLGLIAYALNRGEEHELRVALQLTRSTKLLSQVDSIQKGIQSNPLHRWTLMVLVVADRYSNPPYVEGELYSYHDMVYDAEDEATDAVSLSDTHNTTYVAGIIGATINALQKLTLMPNKALEQRMLVMIQRLKDMRNVILSHRLFLNNGFDFYNQQNLYGRVPQLMAQEGLDPSSRPLLFTYHKTQVKETIFPIPAHSFCYVDDGEHVAVFLTGQRGGLFIFNTRTSSITAKVSDMQMEPFCMAATKSKGSRALATTGMLGTSEKTIQIWDTVGRELHFVWDPKGIGAGKTPFHKALIQQFLTGHTESVTALTFSKNGHTLVSGSDDLTIRIWRRGQEDRWKSVHILNGHLHPIASIATQGSGSTIVSGDTGGHIMIWHTPTLEQHDGKAYPLAEQGLHSTLRVLSILVAPGLSITSLALSDNGRNVVFASKSQNSSHTPAKWDTSLGVVTIIPLASGGYTHTMTGLQGHRSGVISVDFHPTRLTRVVSSSEDGTIKIWEVEFPKFSTVPFSFRCIATTRTHKAQQVSYSPDGEFITSCGDQESENPENHTFRMCSAHVTPAPSHTAKVDSLFVSQDGQTIASRSKDQIMLWSSLGEFQACMEEPLALNDICAAAFSTCGGLIAGGGVKGRIVIWETPSTTTVDNDSTSYEHRGHLCLTPTKFLGYTKECSHSHSQEVQALTFCPTMPWLASAANDGKVIIWDTDRECPLWCMEHTKELIDVDVVSLTFLTTTALLLGIAWPSCGMRVSPRSWTVCKILWQLENRGTDGIWVPICKNTQGNIHEEDARELHKMSLTGPPLMSNESIMPYKWHCDDQESLLSAREQSDSAPLAFFKHSKPITAVLQGINQAMVFGDVEGGVFFVVDHSKKTEVVDKIQLWVELYTEPWVVIVHLSKTSTLSSLHHSIYDKGGIPIAAQSAHYLCVEKGSHSQTLPTSSEILATYGIKEGDTIKVLCRLLGGGGNNKRNKDGRPPTSAPADMSPVNAAFRALQLLNKQEREKREQEADAEAGVESGMGLSEELRKRRAKEAAKAKMQIREGKQRESLALHNLEATAHLEVIQRALGELPKLPEEIDINRIRNLVHQRTTSTEMVELATRATLQAISAEELNTIARSKRLQVGTMTRPEGDRFRITLEATSMEATTTQSKVENWFQGFNPSTKPAIDTLSTTTEAKDEKNRNIIGPKAFRVAISAFPPALLDALFKGDTTMIGGEEYYCMCEGARDHALEIVWEEGSPVKSLFNVLAALDLRDTQVEHFLTNQVRKSMVGPDNLDQYIGAVQVADTGFHGNRGQTRLSYKQGARDSPPKTTLFVTSQEGKQRILEASSGISIEINFGISKALSVLSCLLILREQKQRSNVNPMQRGFTNLMDMRLKAVESGRTFVGNMESRWQEIWAGMDSPSSAELENFLIYATSVTTNMAQSSHKVTATTTDMLTKMTTSLSQILGSQAKTEPAKAAESLLSNGWWQELKDSLHPQEGETPVIFWIKGAAWTDIDSVLSDSKTEHDFGRDKPSRSRRVLMELGASAVLAVKDKMIFQYIMFECSQQVGADIVSKCASIRELKQGALMVKTGNLPLTHVPGEPSVTISWRNTTADPKERTDMKALVAKLKEHLMINQGVIWIQRRDSFDQPLNDGVDTNSEELFPIANGALWNSVGRDRPDGEEIEDEDLAKLVAEHVRKGQPVAQEVLSAIELPTISRDAYLHHDGFFYKPAPPSQADYPHHVFYIAKTMNVAASPTAVYKALGDMRKASDIDFVRFNHSFGLYVQRSCVTDLGRESFPLLLASTLPGTQVNLQPALQDNYGDALTLRAQEGGLWIRNRASIEEEMAPKFIHSLTSLLERNKILDKLLADKKLVIYTNQQQTLLLPKCIMNPQQGEWFEKIPFGTTINSSILPAPTPQALGQVWEILMNKAQSQGFMLLLLKDSPVGEAKFEKLTRALGLLSDREYDDFSHAGWPTFQSLAAKEHPQLFLGSCLTQTIRNLGPMIETVSAVLTGKGEAVLLIVGKTDSSGKWHTPINMYGLSNQRHWKGLSSPLEVSTSLDQRATGILQDQAGRLILEHGPFLLWGWTIKPDPSLEQDTSVFKRSDRRETAVDNDLLLSLRTLPSAYAWIKEGNDCNTPSSFLFRVILSLIMEGVILGGRVKEGTLLTAPDSTTEDVLSAHRPKNNTRIVDLMQLTTSWSSREELELSAKKWAQGKLTKESTRTSDSTKGKRAKRTAGQEEMAPEASDAMEDVTQGLGGEAVVVGMTTEPAKAPRHE